MTIIDLSALPPIKNTPPQNLDAAVRWNRLKRRFSFSPLVIAVLFTLNVYLLAIFYKNLTCANGLLGCGLSGFGVIFPFYLPVMDLVGKMNWFSYSAFYLAAIFGYSAIAYKVIYFFEHHVSNKYSFKYRPLTASKVETGSQGMGLGVASI